MDHNTDRTERLLFRVLAGFGRRLLALVLCAAMLLSLMPHRAQAADPGLPGSLGVTVHSTDENRLSGGASTENTYMLEVSTGSVNNDGFIESVEYLVIYYTDEYDLTKSFVIFPGKDSMSKGLRRAAQIANRDGRRETVDSVFHYSTPSLLERQGLGNLHMDQYLFSTPTRIKTVDRIQILGVANGSSSTWAVQAMHVARVDKIYGLDMYGWYSDDGYIDYQGEIIADVVMASGGGIFYWNSSAGVFNIVGPGKPNGAGVTLLNTATAPSYNKPNHVGEQHDSQVNNRVVFRMDLADIGGAGLECLAGSYAAGSRSTISALQFCEPGCLRVRYVDTYDCTRQVDLPLIINALGWTMEKLGDVAIAGYAQQGDSIAISAMLPDYQRLDFVELSLGESNAKKRTHIFSTDESSSIRSGRISQSESDDISYLCLAAYRDVDVRLELDSATIRCTYSEGAQEPAFYTTAGSIDGSKVKAGSDTRIMLGTYRENMRLLPGDSREYYLISISTDNVVNAGTTDDIYFQFKYLNMRDKEVTTSEMRLRDYVQQFYGEWPGSTANFAFNYGFRSGGSVQLIVPFEGVKQFQSLSIRVDGTDEWQCRGVEIRVLTSYSARIARWEEIDADWITDIKLKSHIRISRDLSLTGQAPCFSMGQVYDEAHPAIDPQSPEWTPGSLVQGDGSWHEFDGSSREISTTEEFDWNNYRFYMTYEDTLNNLGLNKKRCIYDVTVKVAGNKVNLDDEDCGSANLFYFQLIFENGNSGCILANQQIHGDAFRTGKETHFTIPTTQDYGDVLSIRVIPDDQDSNSNIYDKLKIDYIEVKKQNTNKISPTWIADSDSVDGLGWVGVDYRDPGTAASYRGAEGRSVSEIAHTFEITKTTYSTKLLISLSTGAYGSELKENGDGELVPVVNRTLEGGMTMSFNYYNHEGAIKSVEMFDVVDLMNKYSGRDNNFTRTVDGVQETMPFVVSDPNYQFREGTSDKFYVDVTNLASLVDAQLQIRSSVGTDWTLNDVSVYLVNGPGTRYINGNGEYDYYYAEGDGLEYRCSWDQQQPLKTTIQTYRSKNDSDPTGTANTAIATVNITFNENSFPRGEDTQWSSTVTREPKSKNDTLNLFIYPSTESSATSPEQYNLNGTVLYTESITQSAQRISPSGGVLNYTTDSEGRPVFYALGLNASYLDSITGVEVKTKTQRPVHVPISYAVLQRIRDGVLIDTYYLTGSGNADLGITLKIGSGSAHQTMQRVMFQVNQSTPAQQLMPNEKDLAVALYFTTDDPYEKELRTKYVYLTDQDYTSIYPGQVIEADFSIDNVKDILGVNLVSLGRLEIGFENGEILEQSTVGAILNKWSFRGGMAVSRTPARFSTAGTVSLLDLDLKTAVSDGTISSGTDSPIRMTVGYLDDTNNMNSITYHDIRDYLNSQSSFQDGAVDSLRLLIPDMTELRWVEFEPYTENPTNDPTAVGATWKLDTLSAMVDLSGFKVNRVLNQLIVEKEPLRVSLAEILLAGLVSTVYSAGDTGNLAGDYAIPTGGNLDLALNAGEGLRIVPKLQGSKQGVDVTLNRYDPATGGLGQANLVDTRGYTQELLNAYAQSAAAENHFEEYAIWSSLTPDVGYWEVRETYDAASERSDTSAIIFIPPHNYTAETMSYRITITSRENPASTVYVNLSVPVEINPVEQQIAEARARDEAGDETHEHTTQYVAPVAPTCENDGNSGYYFCSSCGRYFADAAGETMIVLSSTVVPKLGHSFGAWTPNGTNSHIRTCARCGSTQTGVCEFDNWTYNSSIDKHTGTCPLCKNTWTEDCYYQYVVMDEYKHDKICDFCGHSETASQGEPHTLRYTYLDESSHIVTCEYCSYQVNEAHSFTVKVVEPTTTEQGYTLHVCSCGYSYKDQYTDPIPPDTSAPTEPTDPTEPTEPTDPTEPTEPGNGIPAVTTALPPEPDRKKEGEEHV